jgi:hypothetical protein
MENISEVPDFNNKGPNPENSSPGSHERYNGSVREFKKAFSKSKKDIEDFREGKHEFTSQVPIPVNEDYTAPRLSEEEAKFRIRRLLREASRVTLPSLDDHPIFKPQAEKSAQSNFFPGREHLPNSSVSPSVSVSLIFQRCCLHLYIRIHFS